MQIYIAEGSIQRGPFGEQEWAGLNLTPQALVWHEGLPQWQPAGTVPQLLPFLHPGAVAPASGPAQVAYATPYSGPANSAYATPVMTSGDVSSKKIAAGICGIMLGTFGVHKFILGLTGSAVTMLCISLGCLVLFPFTCGLSAFALPIVHIIGLIEGIIYLTKTDAEFYQTYILGRRQWF